MLSGFAYSKWQEVLLARCNARGIELVFVNPAYSSQIGLIKFMSMYGLSSDTAAAMVLARRALRVRSRLRRETLLQRCLTMKFSERLPKSYTRIPSKSAYLQGMRKHVWSHWNAVCRGLLLGSRHQYFTSPNRTRKVTLPGRTSLEGRLGSKLVQLALFDLDAISSGSPIIAASNGRSRRRRCTGGNTHTQIS